MKSLFDANETRHVKRFQFDLMQCEEISIKDDNAGKQVRKDHSAENYERKKVMRRPIKLKQLFDRTRKAKGQTQRIHTVLIVGNPGTGKEILHSLSHGLFRKDLHLKKVGNDVGNWRMGG